MKNPIICINTPDVLPGDDVTSRFSLILPLKASEHPKCMVYSFSARQDLSNDTPHDNIVQNLFFNRLLMFNVLCLNVDQYSPKTIQQRGMM